MSQIKEEDGDGERTVGSLVIEVVDVVEMRTTSPQTQQDRHSATTQDFNFKNKVRPLIANTTLSRAQYDKTERDKKVSKYQSKKVKTKIINDGTKIEIKTELPVEPSDVTNYEELLERNNSWNQEIQTNLNQENYTIDIDPHGRMPSLAGNGEKDQAGEFSTEDCLSAADAEDVNDGYSDVSEGSDELLVSLSEGDNCDAEGSDVEMGQPTMASTECQVKLSQVGPALTDGHSVWKKVGDVWRLGDLDYQESSEDLEYADSPAAQLSGGGENWPGMAYKRYPNHSQAEADSVKTQETNQLITGIKSPSEKSSPQKCLPNIALKHTRSHTISGPESVEEKYSARSSSGYSHTSSSLTMAIDSKPGNVTTVTNLSVDHSHLKSPLRDTGIHNPIAATRSSSVGSNPPNKSPSAPGSSLLATPVRLSQSPVVSQLDYDLMESELLPSIQATGHLGLASHSGREWDIEEMDEMNVDEDDTDMDVLSLYEYDTFLENEEDLDSRGQNISLARRSVSASKVTAKASESSLQLRAEENLSISVSNQHERRVSRPSSKERSDDSEKGFQTDSKEATNEKTMEGIGQTSQQKETDRMDKIRQEPPKLMDDHHFQKPKLPPPILQKKKTTKSNMKQAGKSLPMKAGMRSHRGQTNVAETSGQNQSGSGGWAGHGVVRPAPLQPRHVPLLSLPDIQRNDQKELEAELKHNVDKKNLLQATETVGKIHKYGMKVDRGVVLSLLHVMIREGAVPLLMKIFTFVCNQGLFNAEVCNAYIRLGCAESHRYDRELKNIFQFLRRHSIQPAGDCVLSLLRLYSGHKGDPMMFWLMLAYFETFPGFVVPMPLLERAISKVLQHQDQSAVSKFNQWVLTTKTHQVLQKLDLALVGRMAASLLPAALSRLQKIMADAQEEKESESTRNALPSLEETTLVLPKIFTDEDARFYSHKIQECGRQHNVQGLAHVFVELCRRAGGSRPVLTDFSQVLLQQAVVKSVDSFLRSLYDAIQRDQSQGGCLHLDDLALAHLLAMVVECASVAHHAELTLGLLEVIQQCPLLDKKLWMNCRDVGYTIMAVFLKRQQPHQALEVLKVIGRVKNKDQALSMVKELMQQLVAARDIPSAYTAFTTTVSREAMGLAEADSLSSQLMWHGLQVGNVKVATDLLHHRLCQPNYPPLPSPLLRAVLVASFQGGFTDTSDWLFEELKQRRVYSEKPLNDDACVFQLSTLFTPAEVHLLILDNLKELQHLENRRKSSRSAVKPLEPTLAIQIVPEHDPQLLSLPFLALAPRALDQAIAMAMQELNQLSPALQASFNAQLGLLTIESSSLNRFLNIFHFSGGEKGERSWKSTSSQSSGSQAPGHSGDAGRRLSPQSRFTPKPSQPAGTQGRPSQPPGSRYMAKSQQFPSGSPRLLSPPSELGIQSKQPLSGVLGRQFSDPSESQFEPKPQWPPRGLGRPLSDPGFKPKPQWYGDQAKQLSQPPESGFKSKQHPSNTMGRQFSQKTDSVFNSKPQWHGDQAGQSSQPPPESGFKSKPQWQCDQAGQLSQPPSESGFKSKPQWHGDQAGQFPQPPPESGFKSKPQWQCEQAGQLSLPPPESGFQSKQHSPDAMGSQFSQNPDSGFKPKPLQPLRRPLLQVPDIDPAHGAMSRSRPTAHRADVSPPQARLAAGEQLTEPQNANCSQQPKRFEKSQNMDHHPSERPMAASGHPLLLPPVNPTHQSGKVMSLPVNRSLDHSNFQETPHQASHTDGQQISVLSGCKPVASQQMKRPSHILPQPFKVPLLPTPPCLVSPVGESSSPPKKPKLSPDPTQNEPGTGFRPRGSCSQFSEGTRSVQASAQGRGKSGKQFVTPFHRRRGRKWSRSARGSRHATAQSKHNFNLPQAADHDLRQTDDNNLRQTEDYSLIQSTPNFVPLAQSNVSCNMDYEQSVAQSNTNVGLQPRPPSPDTKQFHGDREPFPNQPSQDSWPSSTQTSQSREPSWTQFCQPQRSSSTLPAKFNNSKDFQPLAAAKEQSFDIGSGQRGRMHGSGQMGQMHGSSQREQMLGSDQMLGSGQREQMHGSDHTGQLLSSGQRGQMHGSDQRRQMLGSGQRGQMHGLGQRGQMFGLDQRGKMHGLGQREQMHGLGQRGQMHGSDQRGQMLGSSQKEQMHGSSQREQMHGSSQRGQMHSSDQMGQMHSSDQVGQIYDSDQRGPMHGSDQMHGSGQRGQMHGSGQMGQMHGSDQMGQMLGSDQIGQMHGSDQIGQMHGSDQIGQMHGSGQTGQMHGSDQLGQMHGSRQRGQMHGSGQRGQMHGSRQRGQMHGSGQRGQMHGSGQRGQMQRGKGRDRGHSQSSVRGRPTDRGRLNQSGVRGVGCFQSSVVNKQGQQQSRPRGWKPAGSDHPPTKRDPSWSSPESIYPLSHSAMQPATQQPTSSEHMRPQWQQNNFSSNHQRTDFQQFESNF